MMTIPVNPVNYRLPSGLALTLTLSIGQCLPLLTAQSLAAGLEDLDISTEGGLNVATKDGNFGFKLGGRLMWDTDSFDGAVNRDHDGDRRFNTQLRRSRLEISGHAYRDFIYRFDVDFKDSAGDSNTQFDTVGVGYTGFEWLDIFVGRTKEPFGLEELSSSKSLNSIERNYYSEATDTDSQPQFGVRLDGKKGPIGWSVGLFNPNGNPKKEDGGDRIAFTGRIFGAPINDDNQTLHLGLAFSDRNIDEPFVTNGFKLDVAESGGELDSNQILVDDDRQLGLEALYIRGPFSMQSEYSMRDLQGALSGPGGDVNHYYLQATYSLTGERRGYKAGGGIADIIKPNAGKGAVELVAKLDHIEFDVDNASTQEVDGYLLGVNWYVNNSLKLMLNYIHVDSNNVVGIGEDEDSNVVSTRIQFAF